jgi:hypothetical protein
VSVGIDFQKGVLRSLVGEDVLAVKDANPRISKLTRHFADLAGSSAVLDGKTYLKRRMLSTK